VSGGKLERDGDTACQSHASRQLSVWAEFSSTLATKQLVVSSAVVACESKSESATTSVVGSSYMSALSYLQFQTSLSTHKTPALY